MGKNNHNCNCCVTIFALLHAQFFTRTFTVLIFAHHCLIKVFCGTHCICPLQYLYFLIHVIVLNLKVKNRIHLIIIYYR